MPGNQDTEAEVWNAIAAFEQILEAMPTDRVALETLAEAYEKIGDRANALTYIVQLANVAIEEADIEAVLPWEDKLKSMGAEDPGAQKVLAQLAEHKKKNQKTADAAQPANKAKRRRPSDITHELSLAWDLNQSGQISQDDYNNIVQDLTESSSKHIGVPISVLHVLEDRHFKNADKILAHIAQESGFPLISLSDFELQKNAYTLLPYEEISRRSALVFDLMGPDAMVCVLNPYDTELQDHVRQTIGRPCHFFLVSAGDYDRALEYIKKELSASN